MKQDQVNVLISHHDILSLNTFSKAITEGSTV